MEKKDYLFWVVYFYQYYEKCNSPEQMKSLHEMICEASKEAFIDTVQEVFEIDGDDLL